MDKALCSLLLVIILISVFTSALKTIGIILLVVAGIALAIYLCVCLTDYLYFNGKSFKKLKEELGENMRKYNELNQHIRELEKHSLSYGPEDYGTSAYIDRSSYRYKRPEINSIHNNTHNEYFCSLSVCKNAQAQPFKYLCKYFNIPKDESALCHFESMLNDFLAAEEGITILKKDRSNVLDKYKKTIPYYIKAFRREKFFLKLGYSPILPLSIHFPSYSFKYISPGANSKINCDIVLNISNLENLTSYLNYQIALSRSVRYQRALMTRKLRRHILERDNYTCQICGLSIHTEPNLLLEVDHIIPVSQNGETTLDNLQTLCWRCNRKKGSKILPDPFCCTNSRLWWES